MHSTLSALLQRIGRLLDKVVGLSRSLYQRKRLRRSSRHTSNTSDSTTSTTSSPTRGVAVPEDMAYYSYGRQDLCIDRLSSGLSQFDRDLRGKWEEAMANGNVFRYDLSQIKTKLIEGRHGYIATLNVKRATDRRAPQDMQSLSQPFDSSKFNFNKVRPEEVLMHIRCREGDSEYKDKVIANVSPGDYGHSLIIPQIDSNYPQNLTEQGIRRSLEIMCLSSTRSFRVGFNSLCAYASVNHQHLHCYYTSHTLPAETMTASALSDDMFLLDSDSPTGYGFELDDVNKLDSLAKKLFACTDHMRRSEIAHSLFMTRAPSFTRPSQTVIRVLLWPRVKVVGAKCLKTPFNSAVWEMAGHILVKDEESYESITDESVYQCLKEACLPAGEFTELTETLVQLTQGTTTLQ